MKMALDISDKVRSNIVGHSGTIVLVIHGEHRYGSILTCLLAVRRIERSNTGVLHKETRNA